MKTLKLSPADKSKVEKYVKSINNMFDNKSGCEKKEIESFINTALATWGCKSAIAKSGKHKATNLECAVKLLAMVKVKTE